MENYNLNDSSRRGHFAALFITICFLIAEDTRLYTSLWLICGIFLIAYKIYQSYQDNNFDKKIILAELFCSVKNGELILDLLFWPMILFIIIPYCKFSGCRFSYLGDYRIERFNYYYKNPHYRGIHNNTASEYAERDLNRIMITGEKIQNAVEESSILIKRRSKLALAGSFLLTLLAFPLNYVKAQSVGKKDSTTSQTLNISGFVQWWQSFRGEEKSGLKRIRINAEKNNIVTAFDYTEEGKLIVNKAYYSDSVGTINFQIGKTFTPKLMQFLGPNKMPATIYPRAMSTPTDIGVIANANIEGWQIKLGYFQNGADMSNQNKKASAITSFSKTFNNLRLNIAHDFNQLRYTALDYKLQIKELTLHGGYAFKNNLDHYWKIITANINKFILVLMWDRQSNNDNWYAGINYGWNSFLIRSSVSWQPQPQYNVMLQWEF